MVKSVRESRYGGAAHRRRTLPYAPPPSHPHSLRTVCSSSHRGPSTAAAAASITTFYRVLCPEAHLDAVTAKIPTILADTDASIDLLPPVPGDSVRIIQTSDRLLLTPLGHFHHYSPAQHALLRITDAIIHANAHGLDNDRWVTIKIMAPKPNVGYLIGRGGLTVQKLRKETNAQIRVQDHGPRCVSLDEQVIKSLRILLSLPRPARPLRITDLLADARAREVGMDPKCGLWAIVKLFVPKPNMGYLMGRGGATMRHLRKESNARIRVWDSGPRCLSADEEFVQVKGESSCVKKAVERITDILKESLHHDFLRGHLHLPHQFFPPAHEFMTSPRGRSPSPATVDPSYDPIVFRIICRDDKISSIMDQSADGIGRLLREEVGVDVKVGDSVPSLDGHVVIITSHEGPAHELFPAQEALLHIQSICSNLGDKDNVNTTEVLVPSGWNGCLEGRNESLSEIRKSTGSNVRLLPREFLPAGVFEKDELVQIVGGISEARNALLQLTEKLRSSLYQGSTSLCDSRQVMRRSTISPRCH